MVVGPDDEPGIADGCDVETNGHVAPAAADVLIRAWTRLPLDARADVHEQRARPIDLDEARLLDPLSVAVRVDFARMLTRRGRLNDSLQLVDEGLAVNPAELRLYRERSLALIAMGRDAEGVESLLRYRTLAGTSADDLALLRKAMDTGGLRGYRLQEIEMLRRQLKAGGTWPYGLATALAIGYGALGDREQTIAWLQRCADTLEDGALGMKQGREYDFVRDDPRFQALYRRVGFP